VDCLWRPGRQRLKPGAWNPWSALVVLGGVAPRLLLLAVGIIVLSGCQPTPMASSGPSTAPTPVPTPASTPASGTEALIKDLNGRGTTAKLGSSFLSEPIGGQGTAVCVGAETLQVYEFIDHEAALAASAQIDRHDLSNVGTGIVEWNGRPRFWLRDRIIVLYLGEDEPTDAALRDLLGPPFAESREPGRGFLPTPPCS
jgi:hypothetical protein